MYETIEEMINTMSKLEDVTKVTNSISEQMIMPFIAMIAEEWVANHKGIFTVKEIMQNIADVTEDVADECGEYVSMFPHEDEDDEDDEFFTTVITEIVSK